MTIATGVDQGRGANLLWDTSTLRKGLQRQIFSSLVEMTGSRILVVEQTARELARLVNPRSPADGLKTLYAGFDDPTPIQHLLVYRTDPRTTIQHQIWCAEEPEAVMKAIIATAWPNDHQATRATIETRLNTLLDNMSKVEYLQPTAGFCKQLYANHQEPSHLIEDVRATLPTRVARSRRSGRANRPAKGSRAPWPGASFL